MSDVELIELERELYHQTSEPSAYSILDKGFEIWEGGNQRFTEGVYFLTHSGGRFGDVTLSCDIEGKYLDMSDDFGRKWLEFKDKYDWRNYTDLTKQIQADYPEADGVILEPVIVVWDTKKIKNCKIIKG